MGSINSDRENEKKATPQPNYMYVTSEHFGNRKNKKGEKGQHLEYPKTLMEFLMLENKNKIYI